MGGGGRLILFSCWVRRVGLIPLTAYLTAGIPQPHQMDRREGDRHYEFNACCIMIMITTCDLKNDIKKEGVLVATNGQNAAQLLFF